MDVAGSFLRTSETTCPSYSDHIPSASVAISILGHALVFLPFLIYWRRKLTDLREKCCQFPNLIVTEILPPAGHPRKSYSMLNDVEVLVLRHVGRTFHEPRHGRLEGFLKLKDGSRIVENHGDVSHLRLKALVHLDVLAGPPAFPSPRS
jgi:hypothetical protein